MKKIIGLGILILLSYWIVRPLIGDGYFPMHDDTQVARVVEMGRALRQGQFPVRWVSNLGYGYGYPIFNFYGPLPYYVGGFFYALGLTGLTATKVMMGLGLILSGVTMYIAVSSLVGITGGILAAALYMYAPYHAVDIYVRGAVGEFWALIFLPLIFMGLWNVTKGSQLKGILTGSFGIAGLVVSHTILGYTGMILAGAAATVLGVWYVRTGSMHIVRLLLAMLLLGLGLSSFFWLPAITEMKYTNVASQISTSADFHDHFVCPSQLWNSIWGFGGSAKGCLDGFSLKIGKVHLSVGSIVLLGMVFGLIRQRRAKIIILAGLAVTIVATFMTLAVSVGIWETLPLFAFVQYPWRFLAFVIFGVSLMAGGLVYMTKNILVRRLAVAAVIIMLLLVEAKRFTAQYTYTPEAGQFETAGDIRFRASKISDEYLPPSLIRPAKEEDTRADTITRSDSYELGVVQQSDTYKKFSFLSRTANTVTVRLAYFPGWRIMVNDDFVEAEIENGLPVIQVPSGFTVVQMWFRDTPVRILGNVLSLLSLGVFIYLYDRSIRKTIS